MPQPTNPAQAAAAERARRLAMLADIAVSSGRAGAPVVVQPAAAAPANPYAWGGGGGGGGGGASMYDAYAVAAATGEPVSLGSPQGYKRVRGAAPGGGAGSGVGGASAEDVLPFSVAAQRRAEEEDHMRELGRLTKQDADALAKDREAAAPFATEASVASLEVQIAEKEALLLAANQDKSAVEAELKAIGPSAKTVKDRHKKVELEAQRDGLDKQLSELRRWLKTNVVS